MKRPRLARVLLLALAAVLVSSGTAAADRIEDRQTFDGGGTVRQVIKRAHGRASYTVHIRGIEFGTVCTRFGIERWAGDHWTMRGWGPLTRFNTLKDCVEFRPPIGPLDRVGLGTRTRLKNFDHFSDDHVRRGLRSGRLRLRGVTNIENGPKVELILRS